MAVQSAGAPHRIVVRWQALRAVSESAFVPFSRTRELRSALFPRGPAQCYTITMLDPLAPTAGIGARLLLAAGAVACIWLAVAWARW